MMAVIARGEVTCDLAITQNRLIMIEQGLAVFQLELDQTFIQACFPFRQNRIPADKLTQLRGRFICFDRKAKAGFQNMIFI